MDFELELGRLAEQYKKRGYDVVVRPTPEQLPDFAREFTVELLGKRGGEGVLVAAKKNRDELALDQRLSENVEMTARKPGWRFDLAILGENPPSTQEIHDARELLPEEIDKVFQEATKMVGLGFFDPALVIAWGGFEAAMRQRLRALGERVGWGSDSKSIIPELYSSGVLDREEFRKVETLSGFRNQIVHGYVSSLGSDGGSVQFLCDLGHRLIEESSGAALST